MIIVVAGPIGGGKTCYALDLMEGATRQGRLVYTNIKLTERCPWQERVVFMDDWVYPVVRGVPDRDEECGLCGGKGGDCPACKGAGRVGFLAFWQYVEPGSLVVIDEADVHFWCRSQNKFAETFLRFNKQSRKFGLDIVYIVQRIGNLDLSARSMATKFVVCRWTRRDSRLYAKLPIGMSHFVRAEFGSEKAIENGMPLAQGWVRYAEMASKFGWYETEQLIGDLGLCNSTVVDDGDVESSGYSAGEEANGGDEGGSEVRGASDSPGERVSLVRSLLVAPAARLVRRLRGVHELPRHEEGSTGEGASGGDSGDTAGTLPASAVVGGVT